MTVSAVKPCLTALQRERCLRYPDAAPVLLPERSASICLSEVIAKVPTDLASLCLLLGQVTNQVPRFLYGLRRNPSVTDDYALFTLVGIAGEDDLDAPDLPTPTAKPADWQKPAQGNNGHLDGGGNKLGQAATARAAGMNFSPTTECRPCPRSVRANSRPADRRNR
jgi:hypothetical protein